MPINPLDPIGSKKPHVEEDRIRATLSAMIEVDIITLNILCRLGLLHQPELIKEFEGRADKAENEFFQKTMLLYIDGLKH